jgi:ribonucleoside-diphosphate reductase alpha chain
MSGFLREWEALYNSRSGERGIFNRNAIDEVLRRNGRREREHDFGTNPCSEIILRDRQFCNLTEVVVRPEDTVDTLNRKVKVGTVLGTMQATLTDFRFISRLWGRNCQEEALLGVSLTGIMDHNFLSGYVARNESGQILEEVLSQLKVTAVETNIKTARQLGINPSAAVTCVKPSGTVSQLVDSASGIHPRYSSFYRRTTLLDNKDPLRNFMVEKGFPHNVDGDHTAFYWPHKAELDASTADDVGGVDQLELWKIYAEHWCEHKPSMTCYYTDEDVLQVGQWVYNNFELVSGLSFFPHADVEHTYKNAPYIALTEEEYLEELALMPTNVDWSESSQYELTDNTTGSQELACHAGACEV